MTARDLMQEEYAQNEILWRLRAVMRGCDTAAAVGSPLEKTLSLTL